MCGSCAHQVFSRTLHVKVSNCCRRVALRVVIQEPRLLCSISYHPARLLHMKLFTNKGGRADLQLLTFTFDLRPQPSSWSFRGARQDLWPCRRCHQNSWRYVCGGHAAPHSRGDVLSGGLDQDRRCAHAVTASAHRRESKRASKSAPGASGRRPSLADARRYASAYDMANGGAS